MSVTKKGVERILIKRAEALMEDYIKKVITSYLRVNIDGTMLSRYVEVANKIYPNKTDFEITDMTPLKLSRDIKKRINDAMLSANINATICGCK